MFVMKDGEKLYLSNWGYNSCRILSALAIIVENNGGKVKPQKKPVIVNRTLNSAIHECQYKIECAEKLEQNEKRAFYLKNKREELEEMQAIKNDPIMVTHTTWIHFTLDGFMYTYDVDDNPFFDFHYSKTPIVNNKYSLDAYRMEDKKEWLFDCFFSFSASEADVKEAANLIFNMLVNAKNSEIYREGKKQRVPNIYDGGYHYETIYRPERLETLGEWAK